MQIKHRVTGKVYDCYKVHNGKVEVRTNAEVYPEEFYDFSKSQGDGCTMCYIEELLSDFEILP